jgi:plasmid stabilization system protein ParE
MKVIVRKKADDDLASIFQWIAKDNPRAAAVFARTVTKPLRLSSPGRAKGACPGDPDQSGTVPA